MHGSSAEGSRRRESPDHAGGALRGTGHGGRACRAVPDRPTRRLAAPAGAPGGRPGRGPQGGPATGLLAATRAARRGQRLARPAPRDLEPPAGRPAHRDRTREACAKERCMTTGSNRILGTLHIPDGTADGTGTVRLEDRFDTDIDDLWSAFTDPDRLARWLGKVDGDLREGGEF